MYGTNGFPNLQRYVRVLFGVLFRVPLRVAAEVRLGRTRAPMGRAPRGVEGLAHNNVVSELGWQIRLIWKDENSDIQIDSGMGIGGIQMTVNHRTRVEGTHYDFVGEQESITRVKEVTRASGVCLGR